MIPHILHVHSSFDAGGKETRAVRLMNAFGDAARHSVVSGVPGAMGARALIAPDIRAEFPDPPALTGRPSVARYEAIARFMRRFDLALTYNWGAIDAVMARRIFVKNLPPLIHHEDGFNADEAKGLKRERNWLRRIALPAAAKLAVPSHTLETVALKTWKQPRERVVRIANGVDIAAFAKPPRPGAIPGFRKKKGEVVIGTIAGLRAVKNLPRLVRAVAALPANVRLVIAGEGPERATILAEAGRLGVTGRVHLPGFLPDPARYIGHFDIFALSSLSEQFPIAVVEAMAAGLPVVSPNVGDVARMVSEANAPHIGAIEPPLADFVASEALRRAIGKANRDKAGIEFNEQAMIAAYAWLYGEAMGRPDALVR